MVEADSRIRPAAGVWRLCAALCGFGGGFWRGWAVWVWRGGACEHEAALPDLCHVDAEERRGYEDDEGEDGEDDADLRGGGGRGGWGDGARSACRGCGSDGWGGDATRKGVAARARAGCRAHAGGRGRASMVETPLFSAWWGKNGASSEYRLDDAMIITNRPEKRAPRERFDTAQPAGLLGESPISPRGAASHPSAPRPPSTSPPPRVFVVGLPDRMRCAFNQK